jgi:tRNA A37 threonylcarbamoyladenosine dehydratase
MKKNFFYHESLYRGVEALEKLEQTRLVVCGAGAVGSNLTNNLARQGIKRIAIIDYDRVEPHNIGAQTYTESDIGMFKVDAVQSELFRIVGVEINAVRQKLTEKNAAKLLKDASLVVDGFDNYASRKIVTDYCKQTDTPCLHVGLSADYAEILWNKNYQAPHDVVDSHVCDYPMARNLIQFAVALASEAIIRFILKDERLGFSFTFQDLKINRAD